MSVQDIATFEADLQKLCEQWREKLTHAELVGTLDTVRIGYHIRTIQSFEMCETPVIKGEQAKAPAIIPNSMTITDKPEPIKKKTGSPIPAEVADEKGR